MKFALLVLVLISFVFAEDEAAKAIVETAKKMKNKKGAVKLLEQAIQIDKEYFLAHYELCKAHQSLYGKTFKRETKREIKVELQKALRTAHDVGKRAPDKKRSAKFNKQLDEIIKWRGKYDKAAHEVEQQANTWIMKANQLKKKGDNDWEIYVEAAKKLGFETVVKTVKKPKIVGKWTVNWKNGGGEMELLSDGSRKWNGIPDGIWESKNNKLKWESKNGRLKHVVLIDGNTYRGKCLDNALEVWGERLSK